MNNEILELLVYAWNFIVTESFYFYLTRSYYCKKNMGDCSKCKCWSCRRKYYIRKREQQELNNRIKQHCTK